MKDMKYHVSRQVCLLANMKNILKINFFLHDLHALHDKKSLVSFYRNIIIFLLIILIKTIDNNSLRIKHLLCICLLIRKSISLICNILNNKGLFNI